jgi:hypothetical protein
MPRKKRKESVKQFMQRRAKETGKIKIPEDRDHPLSAGRHPLVALQRHKGIVKKRTAKKLERIAHKRKRKSMEGEVAYA